MLGIASLALAPVSALGAETTVTTGNTVVVNTQSDLGAINDTTVVQNGGTLEITGGAVIMQDLYTLSGNGVAGTGAIHSGGNNLLSGDIELGASTTINSAFGLLTLDGDISSTVNPPNLRLTMGGDGDILYSGDIALGAVGLSDNFVKVGNGKLTLTGTSNSFVGFVDVQEGTLEVSGGGQLTINPSGPADFTAIDANLIITGAGSTFINDYLVLGRGSNPTSVTIDHGGRLYTYGGQIGEGINTANSSQITATVDGADSVWEIGSAGSMVAAAAGGTASLTISNGGVMTSTEFGQISIGRGGDGTATVTGAGSQLSTNDLLTVGIFFNGGGGTGTLVIENGGVAIADETNIGVGTTGIVTVRAGSQLQAGDYLGIGEANHDYLGTDQAGHGELTIEAGGLVAATRVRIGVDNNIISGSSGTLTVLGTSASRGVLETASLMKGDDSASALFDGGILRATGNSADNPSGRDFIGSVNGTFTVDIGDDGMFIDTQNFVVKASAALADDDILNPGLLTKQGSGTLILTGANTYGGDTTVASGILQAGAVNTFSAASSAVVTAGAAMNLAGFDQTIAGLENAGLVATNGAGPGTILTVTGNYTGHNGIVALSTVLGADNSATDLLHIQGASTGAGLLRITNAGGTGAQTVEGIKVIDIDGASGATFTLTNPDYIFDGASTIVAGAYGYRLYQNGVTTPGDGDWYLRSALLTPAGAGGPLYQPGAPVYEAYASVLQGFNGLDTLQQRVGNRSWTNGVVDTGVLPEAAGAGSGIWGRISGRHASLDSKSSTTGAKYDSDTWQLQAGADGQFYAGNAGKLIGGLSVRYGTIAADVFSIFGDGSIASTGYGMGGSLTWYGSSGFYLDAQANLTWYDSDLASSIAATSLVSGNNGFGYALGVEAGQQIALGPNWSVTPQAQLVYSAVDHDSFTDGFGAAVALADADSLKIRLGISADYQNSWTDEAGRTSRLHAYGITNLYYDAVPKTATDLAGVRLTSMREALWGGIGVGGTYNWGNDNYALHGEAALNTTLINFGDSYDITGTAGLSVRF